ncbi:UbiD family decarboxylase [Thermoanaerobacteraceae bacterium SP2]|jgi:2,5-furandicarboxylate decarboxylase 1|nr:UbiD family decarboxylase [Thermoanaerobacteraceae bacterium SP2]
MSKDLRSFLKDLERQMPEDIVRVKREIDPKFEITAIQQHLENQDKFPLLIFEKVKNLKGELSPFKVVTNMFATRQKCAVAMDLSCDQWRMETSFQFAKRSQNLIKPVIVSREEAPVKEVVKVGDEVDLRELPVLTHHEMDGYPYLVDAVIAPDPDTGVYNSSHHRMLIRGKDELGLWMSPRHLWNYCVRAAKKGEALPIAHVLGHHPGFYLGSEALVSMETDEYEVIGGVLNEPLRLVPSEAFGEKLLVPADAEIVVEGEVIPNFRDAEGPFGEFTGYYGPQRWSPVVKVKAITYRKDAYYMNILVGHPDTSILGGIPKEAGIYEEVKKSVPGVKAVHFPISGCCRFHAYISIDKKVDGEGKVAAIASLPYHDELKHVIVVDSDIDPFNEKEVLWAVATRVQASEDVDIIKKVRGGSLDPSSTIHAVGDKMLIDATKPVSRPYAERIKVPQEVMDRIKLDEWIQEV